MLIAAQGPLGESARTRGSGRYSPAGAPEHVCRRGGGGSGELGRNRIDRQRLPLVDPPVGLGKAHWYHRDQRGSWSLKAVLPTLAPELGYDALEVKDGGSAQEAYVEAIGAGCSGERREALDVALRTYCGRDTWAMVVVARGLEGEA